MPQFPHLYKGDQVSSYLLVPCHLEAFTFRPFALKALSPNPAQSSHDIEGSLLRGHLSRGAPSLATALQHILRSKSSSAALTSLSLTGPRRPSHEFLCLARYVPQVAGPAPHPDSPPTGETRCSLPSLQHNKLQLPATPAHYSNKLITSSHGNQGSPQPLVTAKPTSHKPCWFILLPGAGPDCHLPVALCSMWWPPPLGYEPLGLINCCCMFGHLALFRAEGPFVTKAVNR